jgi:hypothetical protein
VPFHIIVVVVIVVVVLVVVVVVTSNSSTRSVCQNRHYTTSDQSSVTSTTTSAAQLHIAAVRPIRCTEKPRPAIIAAHPRRLIYASEHNEYSHKHNG